jgi:hypothetical protein
LRTPLFFSLVSLLVVSSGCATAEQRSHYQLAREFINQEHNKAIFGPDSPWVSPQGVGLDGITPETLKGIQEKYFAVTKDRIGEECTEHFLACKDPLTFEYVVRNVHNSEILASKASKLKSLDEWAKGGSTDEELLKTIGWKSWPDVAMPTANRSPALAQRP